MEEVKTGKVFQRGRGGSDPEHQADEALYHALLKRHDELERTTVTTEKGIESVTRVISGDPALIATLQSHVEGMYARYGKGRAVRSWDPLFVELFDHREALDMRWEMLDDGIRVILTSEDPALHELILRHDQTLHAFVELGFEASRHESPYRPEA